MAVFAMLFNLYACGGGKHDADNYSMNENRIVNSQPESSDSASKKSTLLTPEELISICGLTEDEYKDKDLNFFIEFFMLTKENVTKYNVHALLADHIKTRNVEYLFDGTAEKRTSDLTKDISCIAFYENINTACNSVFIDFNANKKWVYESRYIFWDLDSFDSKDIPADELNQLTESFDEFGVFSLKDKINKSNITDPMSFTFVVEYEDGSRFKVSRSGLPSKILPDFYDEWREILFS